MRLLFLGKNLPCVALLDTVGLFFFPKHPGLCADFSTFFQAFVYKFDKKGSNSTAIVLILPFGNIK